VSRSKALSGSEIMNAKVNKSVWDGRMHVPAPSVGWGDVIKRIRRVFEPRHRGVCATCVHHETIPESLGKAVRCLEGPPSAILTQQGVMFVFPVMALDASCHRWRKGKDR